MLRHSTNQTARNYGVIAMIILLGLAAGCRVRPAPGSVTPVVDSVPPVATITPLPYSPPEVTVPVPSEPSPTSAVENGQVEVTPATPDVAVPEPTVLPETTGVPTESPPSGDEGGAAATPTPPADPGSSVFVPGSTVQHLTTRGEWLLQIARCYGTTYEAVRAANALPNPNYIRPETIINIPAIGSNGPIIGPPCVLSYTVQPGDTWESLAQQFGTTTTILQRANPGPLIAGQPIWVPRVN